MVPFCPCAPLSQLSSWLFGAPEDFEENLDEIKADHARALDAAVNKHETEVAALKAQHVKGLARFEAQVCIPKSFIPGGFNLLIAQCNTFHTPYYLYCILLLKERKQHWSNPRWMKNVPTRPTSTRPSSTS